MRLILILNEAIKGSHDDIYSALDDLRNHGNLESYEVISFLALLKSGKSQNEVFDIIYSCTKAFKPSFILWSHTVELDIPKQKLDLLKQLSFKPVMGYWDGDIYQSPYKKLPKNVIQLCLSCEVVFCQGFGSMTAKLRSAGCEDIRYVPASTSSHRFEGTKQPRNIEFDVVMIGNKVIRKNPFLTMPGTRLRSRLVKKMYKEFGSRFAVYGNGWKGPYAKGPVPFNEQTNIYHTAKVIVGNNNLHSKYYFSNRLPIALSSGVPLLYNQEEGVQEIFPENIVSWYSDEEDALNKVKKLLDYDQSELDELGESAKTWVFGNMKTTDTFSYMIRVLNELKNKSFEKVKNPWLKSDLY